jgi:hypothetical protein
MAITLTGDPRHDLERLPSETLYTVARNEAAAHGDLALRVLVERGSDCALRDDVAERARELVLLDPLLLKKVNPAAAVISLTMPGVIDCIADNQQKAVQLAQVVYDYQAANAKKMACLEATVDGNHTAAAQALADETGALGQAVSEWQRQLKQDYEHRIATLDSTVTANNAASDLALRDACAGIWKDFSGKMWQLTQDHDAQRTNFDAQLTALQTTHAGDMQAASVRLALLERSPWRRLIDSCNRLTRRWSKPLQ